MCAVISHLLDLQSFIVKVFIIKQKSFICLSNILSNTCTYKTENILTSIKIKYDCRILHTIFFKDKWKGRYQNIDERS
jgi:hypothetical protein